MSARALALLGMPTLGLALAITTVSALVPLILRQLTQSSAVIGAVVAGEGLLALILPLWIGPLSDRTRSRLGGRLPYVVIGAPLCAVGLAAIPFAHSIVAIALWVLTFYVGYFVYYPAYRALFPDVVPHEQLGRSQGIQTLFRETGLALALTLGPLLFSVSAPLPFALSAAAVAILSAVFVLRIRRKALASERAAPQRAGGALRPRGEVLRVLLANVLWEFALAGLKTFVVLYIVAGLNSSVRKASLLMGAVAVIAMIAAPIAGKLGDKFGILRVMRAALIVFAVGLLLPAFTESRAILLSAMPLIGFGGAVAMTLPYALLAEHLPESGHGAGAGWYEFSRGAGALSGPIVTGAVIDLARPWFQSTHGYGAMWLVIAVALLGSLPLLPRANAAAREHPRGAPNG